MLKRFARWVLADEQNPTCWQCGQKNHGNVGFEGRPEATIKLMKAGNGLIVEYVGGYNASANIGRMGYEPYIDRRIIVPEDADKLGEVIVALHVAAALEAAK